MATELLTESLQRKSRDELNVIAKGLRIPRFRKKNKDDLVAAILSNDPQKVANAIKMSWWHRYNHHVYGVASVLGVVLAVAFYVWSTSSTSSGENLGNRTSEDSRVQNLPN